MLPDGRVRLRAARRGWPRICFASYISPCSAVRSCPCLHAGKHVGHAEVLPDGRVRLHVAWGDPLGGTGYDTFSSPLAGVLHVDTVLALVDKTLEYRTVYRQRGGA